MDLSKTLSCDVKDPRETTKGQHLEESTYLKSRKHMLCSGPVSDHPGEA